MSNEAMKNAPLAIEGEIKMSGRNEAIILYTGEFSINYKEENLLFDGQFIFEWSNTTEVRFNGQLKVSPSDKLINEILTKDDFLLNSKEIEINGKMIGKSFITKLSLGNNEQIMRIDGILHKQVLFGDITIPVNRVSFCIPNLRELKGSVIKKNKGNNDFSLYMGRIKLEYNDYMIIIDRRFVNGPNDVNIKGGFIITHYGEIQSTNDHFYYKDIQSIVDILNKFLYFINGRRTSVVFINAFANDELQWRDYTGYNVVPYKSVPCWSSSVSPERLNEIWIGFNNLCKNEQDKYILNTILHWYIEANGNAGLLEGSIIMAQTALELLFNWWLIEKKKLVKNTNREIEFLSAANKLRLLLSSLNISYEIPIHFKELISFAKSIEEKDIDAPYIITSIRNSIVHPKVGNSKIKKIDGNVQYQSLQLSLWYIELSLLKILNYNGEYSNRCNTPKYYGNELEIVPWANQIQAR